MPVSLERLIQEVEPNVITTQLIRDCIQISGVDPEAVADKKRSIPFAEVECLSFSYRGLAKIDSLKGLDSLTKLQLDNNSITAIANLSHLTNLTWLDLSFNKITKIEGLSTLTKLTDLSLFGNQITVIENLDMLVNLNALSLGQNNLKQLDGVLYLRQFKHLRLINLAGNPFCKDHDYRSYILSRIKDLTYLDYRRVAAADVQAAMEQHQDDMMEIQEREEQAASAAKLAAEKAAHDELLRGANLDGVETLADDMVKDDPEWPQFVQIPGLTESWNEVREKLNTYTEEFKMLILDQYKKKKAEHAEWLAVVSAYLAEQEVQAKDFLMAYEKTKKRAVLAVAGDPSQAESLVVEPKMQLVSLRDQLLRLEEECVEVLQELLKEFDRNYSEMAETNKVNYNQYFTQVRDLQNNYIATLTQTAMVMYEKYNQESGDVESLPEEARGLLMDKDTLMNALQSSHEAHIGKVDTLEDRLINTEIKGANDLVLKNNTWAATRNRDRISEIINYVERNMIELDELAGEETDLGEG